MKISNFSWTHQRNEVIGQIAYNLKFKETGKSRIAGQICLLRAGATGDMNW